MPEQLGEKKRGLTCRKKKQAMRTACIKYVTSLLSKSVVVETKNEINKTGKRKKKEKREKGKLPLRKWKCTLSVIYCVADC